MQRLCCIHNILLLKSHLMYQGLYTDVWTHLSAPVSMSSYRQNPVKRLAEYYWFGKHNRKVWLIEPSESNLYDSNILIRRDIYDFSE